MNETIMVTCVDKTFFITGTVDYATVARDLEDIVKMLKDGKDVIVSRYRFDESSIHMLRVLAGLEGAEHIQ